MDECHKYHFKWKYQVIEECLWYGTILQKTSDTLFRNKCINDKNYLKNT